MEKDVWGTKVGTQASGITQAIIKHAPASIKDLVEITGAKETSVRRHIATLQERGDYVRNVDGRYVITEAGARAASMPTEAASKGDRREAYILSKAIRQLERQKYFSPDDLDDAIERTLREVVQRRGQPQFRQSLIRAYQARCAVTGCDAVAALEAAHIVPYRGPHTNHVSNGLLLRSDVHTLFDLDLIGIDPKTRKVALSSSLRETKYAKLRGKRLARPSSEKAAPSQEALNMRWEQFRNGQK